MRAAHAHPRHPRNRNPATDFEGDIRRCDARQFACEFSVYIRKEVKRWHKLIVDARIPQNQ